MFLAKTLGRLMKLTLNFIIWGRIIKLHNTLAFLNRFFFSFTWHKFL